MAHHYLYVTSANESFHGGRVDYRRLITTLLEWGVIKEELRADPGTRLVLDAGEHCQRLFLSTGGDNGYRFESIACFALPRPVPIPILTDTYPVFCPRCKAAADDAFREALGDFGFEEFYDGVPLTLTFLCDACAQVISLKDLINQTSLLHRRAFLEFQDGSQALNDGALFTEESRTLLEETFQGPLLLRSGSLL